MNTKNKYIIIFAIILITAIFVWFFSSIIGYILASVVMSLTGQPIMKLIGKIRFGKYEIPHVIRAFLTLLVLIGLIIAVISIFIPIITYEVDILSKVDYETFYNSFKEPLTKLEAVLLKYNLIAENENIDTILYSKISSFINISKFSDIFDSFVDYTGNLFVAIFAISFITFFFLKDERLFLKGVMLLTPLKYQMEIKHILIETKRLLTRYFIGLCLDVVAVIILISLGMTIIGIDNALIIGFFAGLMNVIPYIGPIIGACIGVVLGLSVNLNADFYSQMLPDIFRMLGVFLTVNIIDASVLQPYIYSRGVKAHPLEIFIVIMMAGTLAGIPGMILAIPSYTVLRIVAKEFFNQLRIVKKLTEDI
ncbi:MAG: AI-2E family transporter [Bacteroidales bacterium]|nr:AI-2E family transporter [Bacteroidales bacterium]